MQNDFKYNYCDYCLKSFDALNYDKDSIFGVEIIDTLSISINYIMKCCPYCDSILFEKVYARLMEDEVEYFRR